MFFSRTNCLILTNKESIFLGVKTWHAGFRTVLFLTVSKTKKKSLCVLNKKIIGNGPIWWLSMGETIVHQMRGLEGQFHFIHMYPTILETWRHKEVIYGHLKRTGPPGVPLAPLKPSYGAPLSHLISEMSVRHQLWHQFGRVSARGAPRGTPTPGSWPLAQGLAQEYDFCTREPLALRPH